MPTGTGKIKINVAKILVVDDEPEITEIVQAFLENVGYQVMAENSSVMGVERARNFKPDLILLDISMPHMDGYDVCKELKKSKVTSGIPVVFLSGKDAKEDGGRSFQSGGDMYIKKPFSCERLLDIVRIVLSSLNR
ncbi:MAG: response regulator [candidate division Zixibacteria bacterium]|nr:response regulator [candidate division Zixibacteria bacterium]MCI0595390.1 response regulator [candidate division Zixibacteria bacterium]